MKYLKKIFFISKAIFKIIICIILLMIILILRPFKKIKIIELETRAIGHFSQSVEIFLCEVKKNIHKKDEVYLAFTNKTIANEFLYKKWKPFFIIGPKFLKIFFNFLRSIPMGNFFLAPYRHWKDSPNNWNYFDQHDVLSTSDPIITFTKDEKNEGDKLLKFYDLEINRYICFDARSSVGRKEGEELNNRNSSINTQIHGIQKLCQKNFKALRMGAKGQEKILNNDKNIIDYANSNQKSAFNDIYLLFNCSFMVSTGSGVDCIPLLNRKKRLHLNFFLNSMHTINSKFTPIVVPKKFIDINTKSPISFRKALELGLDKYLYKDKLNFHGYDTIDNSNEEIEEAIFEMYDLIFNKKKLVISDMLNKKFWNDYEKYNSCRSVPSDLIISPSFIYRNKDLFI